MKSTSFSVFLFVILINIQAREVNINFQRISPPGGLSSESVNAIIQDRYDCIWISTNHGLIKYNNKNSNYFSDVSAKNKDLKNDIVQSMANDKDGVFWIATHSKICTLSVSTQTFTKYDYSEIDGTVNNTTINTILSDKIGNIWIADAKGIGVLNKSTKQIKRLPELSDRGFQVLFCDKLNRLWAGTSEGAVWQINTSTMEATLIIQKSGRPISTIYSDKDNLWVGHLSSGLYQYSTQGTLKKRYNFNQISGIKNSDIEIRKVIKDHDDNLWIASYHGLLIETPNGTLKRLDSEKYDGLPHSSTFAIYEDRQKGIWVGTWAGGLSYYNKASNKFINYSHSKDPHSISNNIVSCFTEHPNGSIIVGTERGGLNLFDKQTGTFSPLHLNKEKTIFNIKDQCFDRFGGHWVATKQNGLWYKTKDQKTYTHFTKGPENGRHISSHEVYSLVPVDSGLWIGTHGGGINFYHFKTKKLLFQSSIFPNEIANFSPYIRSMIIDSQSNLWVGTVRNITCIPLGSKNIRGTIKTQVQGYTYTINEVNNGEIWIGTKTGLIIYKPTEDIFKQFNASKLLIDKSVYGILEDNNHHIWITSNDGLMLYKPEFLSVKRYSTSDGIQGLWFNPKSIYMDQDSLLYFGGTNGFTTINPNNIKINTRPPKVIINDIIINNEKHLYPFYTSIDSTDNKLILKPHETTLRFEFKSDNYLIPTKNRFQYRLVNFYEKWIESGQETSAMFANLDWGTYIFEVRSCNNDDIWCLQPARVQITIAKPFYATHTAYLIYFFIIGIILYSLIHILKARAKLKNDLLLQAMHHKQEEQINELKMSFFTNVSHEFKTPLSLISGPAKSLMQATNLTEAQKGMVDIIQRNSKRLLMLINQIIDFRKIQKGKEKLIVSSADIVTFLKDRSLHFSFDTQSRSISFVQNYPDNPINMEFDPEKLDYIIFNLLSNAFKFTPNGKKITLSLVDGKQLPDNNHYQHHVSFGEMMTDTAISIAIEDEGSGIDAEDIKKVFNRFEQGKNLRKNSSGIGLSLCRDFTLLHKGQLNVFSSPGKGSCFVVQLPLKQEGENIYFESYTPTMAQDSSIQETKQDAQKQDAMVLIVDDNPDLRMYITSVLNPFYKTKTAENGKIALEILQTTAIDIIVSDVMMPEMDGFELCAKIKSNIATSHLPVILLTALSSTESHITGMQLGADAYIAKPFSDDLLLNQINNLLVQRTNLRKHFGPQIPTGESTEINGLDNYFLKKLNDAIEEHLNDDTFDIEQLTGLIGISRSQLHRKLKNLTNYSTSEYIRVYRLEKSIALLKSGQYNIDEVAHVVGFSTHSYYSRCFKKHYNQSPRDYLNNLKKSND